MEARMSKLIWFGTVVLLLWIGTIYASRKSIEARATSGKHPVCLRVGLRYSEGAVIRLSDNERIICRSGRWVSVMTTQ
jgi:hypothetical protein